MVAVRASPPGPRRIFAPSQGGHSSAALPTSVPSPRSVPAGEAALPLGSCALEGECVVAAVAAAPPPPIARKCARRARRTACPTRR
jgi:hypothetical protein